MRKLRTKKKKENFPRFPHPYLYPYQSKYLQSDFLAAATTSTHSSKKEAAERKKKLTGRLYGEKELKKDQEI